MIIQVILTAGLTLCAVYAFLQKKDSRYLNLVIYGASIVGTYFVWLPEHTTTIAQTLGVGRGTDLVLYLWLLISIVIGFNVHVKLSREAHKTTLLARYIALMTAHDQELRAQPSFDEPDLRKPTVDANV